MPRLIGFDISSPHDRVTRLKCLFGCRSVMFFIRAIGLAWQMMDPESTSALSKKITRLRAAQNWDQVILRSRWKIFRIAGEIKSRHLQYQYGPRGLPTRRTTERLQSHYLRIMKNGDIGVQWENMSEGKGGRGTLISRKRS